MLTSRELIEDCAGYGTVLRAWTLDREIMSSQSTPNPHPALGIDDAQKFVQSTYAIIQTKTPRVVYRFYETADLRAPYGEDHPSAKNGMAQKRAPAKMLGGWWSPFRPSLLIDGLGYSSVHKAEVRFNIAVAKEWNRMDYCVEAVLRENSFVYAGRVASQYENRAFETDEGRTILYGGGAMQFLLVRGASHIHLERVYRVV